MVTVLGWSFCVRNKVSETGRDQGRSVSLGNVYSVIVYIYTGLEDRLFCEEPKTRQKT